MPSHKQKEDGSCARWYADDGVDLREDKLRDAEHGRKRGRKLQQLCKQVARTLELAFGMLPQADALTGLSVHEVTPAPNAGRLCAVILVPDPRRREEVAAILRQHTGRFRSEVAEAITRRRAPELVFAVVVERGDGR